MRSGPRTLHLLARRAGGGTERNVRRLCRAVQEFEWVALEDLLGWPFDWMRLPRALAQLRSRCPEVVFPYGASSHLVAALAFPLRTAIVGNLRCTSDFAGHKALLQTVLDRRVAFWVSNSAAALGQRPGRVIPNGIPLPPREEPPLVTGLEHPVYGVLARGDPKKGHAWLLGVWRELKPRGTLLFGGRLPDALRRQAEAHGVRCLGHVRPGPFLRSLDMMLLPSSAEGQPTVVLEAMIRGIPVLATPVGGVAEMGGDGVQLYRLPRADWPAFLSHPPVEEFPRVGVAGRAHARRHHTMGAMVRAFRQAAQEAAGG